jgi:hypothetical protein
MRIPALALLIIVTVSASAPARSQTYDPDFPVCMGDGGAYGDCRYYTIAQCQASATGRAGQCEINPYYRGPRESLEGPGQRHPRG